MKHSKRTIAFTVAILSLLLLSVSGAMASDVKPEEVVSKHLDSIGTAQARAAANSRVVKGKADFKMVTGGNTHLEGTAVLVSQGNKFQLLMKFPNNDYRGEQFIVNGDKTQVAATTANYNRSTLGEFVYVQNVILKEGLVGGALSTAWPLLDLNDRKAKLSYEGMKKVDGNQLMEFQYKPKKSNGVDVHLYFDPATYHHVMTVYFVSIRAGLANIDAQLSSAVATPDAGPGVTATGGIVTETSETATAHQQETRFRMEERFSDFQTTNGITLPTQYRIQFSQELKNGKTSLNEWDVATQEVINGGGVDDRNFAVK